MPAGKKPGAAPSPGESGSPGSSTDYAEVGRKIKAKYGKTKPPTAAAAPAPAPAQPEAEVKFRYIPNVAAVYTKWSDEYQNMRLQQEFGKTRDLQKAYEIVGQEYGADLGPALAKDGIRYNQINERDLTNTVTKDAAKRARQPLDPNKVPGGAMLSPEDQQKVKDVEDKIVADEGAAAMRNFNKAYEGLHGKPLPKTYEEPKAMEMPEEEITVDAAAPGAAPAPPQGKKMFAEAAEEPARPGMGDLQKAEGDRQQAEDLRKKLTSGVKAWNAEKLATEDVGEDTADTKSWRNSTKQSGSGI